MFKKYFNQIFVDKFSILSQYGNLSEFNYEKMKCLLSNWQHRFNGNDTYFDAEWNDGSTRIKIRYQTNSGAFIQIVGWLRKRGGEFIVTNIVDSVRKVFTITRLENHIRVATSM
ncbi:MAG: hypothetical protein RLZZ309_140, partial [Bacteroidota bacterium]